MRMIWNCRKIITYLRAYPNNLNYCRNMFKQKRRFRKHFKIKFEHNKRYCWKQSKIFMVWEFVVELKSSWSFFFLLFVHTYISITIKKGRFCFTLFLGPKCILSLFMVFRRPKMYLCKRHLATFKKRKCHSQKIFLTLLLRFDKKYLIP